MVRCSIKVEVFCWLCQSSKKITEYRFNTSKNKIFFCSRACKDKAQSFDGGCKSIRPPHYTESRVSYSEIAFRNLPNCCADCGLDFLPLLEVHHIDHDRENNVLSNLLILCPNHHAMRHLKKDVLVNGDVRWSYSPASLTSQADLEFLIKEKYDL